MAAIDLTELEERLQNLSLDSEYTPEDFVRDAMGGCEGISRSRVNATLNDLGYYRCLTCQRSDFDTFKAFKKHVKRRRHGYHRTLKATICEFREDNGFDDDIPIQELPEHYDLTQGQLRTIYELTFYRACLKSFNGRGGEQQ